MTRAASNGRFDLNAAAAKAAAKEKPFAFTFNGRNYEVPPSAQWPLEVMDNFATGDLSAALGQLLGERQYQELLTAGITVGALNVLFEEVARNAGLAGGLPNSATPPPRSATMT